MRIVQPGARTLFNIEDGEMEQDGRHLGDRPRETSAEEEKVRVHTIEQEASLEQRECAEELRLNNDNNNK